MINLLLQLSNRNLTVVRIHQIHLRIMLNLRKNISQDDWVRLSGQHLCLCWGHCVLLMFVVGGYVTVPMSWLCVERPFACAACLIWLGWTNTQSLAAFHEHLSTKLAILLQEVTEQHPVSLNQLTVGTALIKNHTTLFVLLIFFKWFFQVNYE